MCIGIYDVIRMHLCVCACVLVCVCVCVCVCVHLQASASGCLRTDMTYDGRYSIGSRPLLLSTRSLLTRLF
jgi:hypothetical protein